MSEVPDNVFTRGLRDYADELGFGREDRTLTLDGLSANVISSALRSAAREIDDLRANALRASSILLLNGEKS